MNDDLVKRLNELSTPERRKHGSLPDIAMKEAADRIHELEELLIDISCDCQHFCEYDWVMEHCPHKKAAIMMENKS